MTHERPSEHRRRVLQPYICFRLDLEASREHGYGARVARETGYTPGYISTLKRGERGISDDGVQAFAKFWKIPVEKLTRLAEEWAGSRSPEDDASPAARVARLVDHVLAEDQARGRTYTADQIRKALSLAAVGGKITREDVREALLTVNKTSVDGELEHEHIASRGRRKRKR